MTDFLTNNSQDKHVIYIICRVATDMENLEKSRNLKETSESQGICPEGQGICDRIPKVREFATEFQKSGNFVV